MTIKITTYYSSVEKTVYELAEYDVERAVLQYLVSEGNIKKDKPERFIFDWTTDDHEKLIVEITKIYEQPKESDL